MPGSLKLCYKLCVSELTSQIFGVYVEWPNVMFRSLLCFPHYHATFPVTNCKLFCFLYLLGTVLAGQKVWSVLLEWLHLSFILKLRQPHGKWVKEKVQSGMRPIPKYFLLPPLLALIQRPWQCYIFLHQGQQLHCESTTISQAILWKWDVQIDPVTAARFSKVRLTTLTGFTYCQEA